MLLIQLRDGSGYGSEEKYDGVVGSANRHCIFLRDDDVNQAEHGGRQAEKDREEHQTRADDVINTQTTPTLHWLRNWRRMRIIRKRNVVLFVVANGSDAHIGVRGRESGGRVGAANR